MLFHHFWSVLEEAKYTLDKANILAANIAFT